MQRDLEYEKNNIGYDYQYPKSKGGGIKCKNYKVCRSVLPKWWRDCKGDYICIDCDIKFGKWKNGKCILKEFPNHTCPICLEKKTCFEQPQCEHSICDKCFRCIYFGDIPEEIIEVKIGKEPEHPYENILSQYETLSLDYDDLTDPIKYPLTKQWEIDINKWREQEEKLIEELSTNKCCLCRIKN